MSNEATSSGSRKCRRCGAPLASDAPGSACWSCMIAAGTSSSSESKAADPFSADKAPASDQPAIGLDVVRVASAQSPGIALDDDDVVGQTIGTYKLRELLGEGGCGVVYVAEQFEPVRRRVALKLIKPGMDSKQVIARFEAERQALAMMDHPNIAKVL